MPATEPTVRLPLRKRLAFAAATLLAGYAVLELAVSAAWTRVVPSVYWVFEESGPAVHFDPVSGYRVHGGPARVAKFVRSRNPFGADVEYIGGFAGNAQGFPDRDDFRTARAGDGARLVVLGDSFSGGDLLRAWPDACEDAVAATGERAELLNFSLTGIGLANWHSILTREIEPAGYDVDGVVFAVWGNDLARRFYVCDHEGSSRHLGGRAKSWEPETLPKTRDEALAVMGGWDGYVVGRAEFESALAGSWTPTRRFAPFVAGSLIDRLSGAPQGQGAVGAAEPGTLAADLADTTRGRGRLVREMRDALGRIGVPVTVVSLPSIEELLARRRFPAHDDARAFADFLGARLLDGADAFAGLDDAALRAHWYPVDLHWNQDGSDRFASWMAAEVTRWPVRAGTVRADAPDRRTGDAR